MGYGCLFLAAVEPAAAAPSAMDVSGRMVILTWVAFSLAMLILNRIAWKPMLRVLDRRERAIRKSMEDAEAARKAAEEAQAERKAIAERTEAEMRRLLDEARRKAESFSAEAQSRASEEARRMIDEAARQIEQQRRQALESLRAEAALLSESATRKILEARDNPERNRDVLEQWLTPGANPP